jgi:hypothetical protein
MQLQVATRAPDVFYVYCELTFVCYLYFALVLSYTLPHPLLSSTYQNYTKIGALRKQK